MTKKVAMLVFVLTFIFSGAHAMNLSSSDLERFIKTTKLLTPYFDELDEDYDDEDDDMAIFSMEETKRLVVEAMSGNSEMRNIVKSNGYSSVDVYAEKYAHIFRAYLASSGMEGFDELERSMASMSPEQRQAFENSPLFQMVSESKQDLASVPDSHIQAIAPYMSQLHELFENDDDDDIF